MKKKVLSLLLAVTMIVGALSACGQKVDSSKETTPKNFNEEGYPIVDEPIELNIMIQWDDVFAGWADPSEVALFDELAEKTGINLTWDRVLTSDWETKTNLMWASEEYPDVIFGDIDVEKYGVDEGVLIPLDELIEKYVPNMTERVAMESGDILAGVRASDGNLYSVPYIDSVGHIINHHAFINQTWLDALDMEMPTDIEGLTEALRAFKTQDPNGNGEEDEIPMLGRIDNILLRSTNLFGLPMDSNNLYIDENKEVQFALVQDEYRECLEWLHILYSEGLMDSEVMTMDEGMLDAKKWKSWEDSSMISELLV